MNKFLCLLLLMVCLTACEGDTYSNTTKITLWHGINPPENRVIFSKLVKEFNANHPGIFIEELYLGQSDQQLPKIFTAIVGDQTPDLLWYSPQLTGKLVDLGAILPLEDWLNNSPMKEEIEPGLWSSMELDNHIWGVPFATNNTAVFYRPSLWEKAGIKNIPKTATEFQEVAKKLTKDVNGDGKIDQHGVLLSLGKGEWVVFVWLPFIYSADGQLLHEGKPTLVNTGNIQALQFGVDLVTSGTAILSAPERGYELEDFIKGKVAMQVTGPWTLGQLKQTNIDYAVMPIPILEKPATVVGGENLFVFKKAGSKWAEIHQFLEYILGEEFQLTWALQTGYLPINIKVKESEAYREFVKENPVLEVFLQQMEWARSRPIIANYPSLSENLGRAIEASILGKLTPEQALQQAQQRLELSFRE